MVPPSLAYYAVHSHDITYLGEASVQCEAYYEALVDEGSGCLRHFYNIEEGEGRKRDEGSWSTGNGWGVWGMCRVLSILQKSRFRQDMQAEERYSEWAVRKVDVVKTCVDFETGIVASMVNPTKDQQREPLDGVRAEAKAFVVLGFVAWREWIEWGNGGKVLALFNILEARRWRTPAKRYTGFSKLYFLNR